MSRTMMKKFFTVFFVCLLGVMLGAGNCIAVQIDGGRITTVQANAKAGGVYVWVSGGGRYLEPNPANCPLKRYPRFS